MTKIDEWKTLQQFVIVIKLLKYGFDSQKYNSQIYSIKITQ